MTDTGKTGCLPRKPVSTGAARMSSQNGSGTRWKPGGSRQPLSSTFSACQRQQAVSAFITWTRGTPEDPGAPSARRGYIGDKCDRDALTCGSTAQKMGDELRRVSASAMAIFFFLIIVRSSAVKVRLLPEYVWNTDETPPAKIFRDAEAVSTMIGPGEERKCGVGGAPSHPGR